MVKICYVPWGGRYGDNRDSLNKCFAKLVEDIFCCLVP